MPYYQTTTVEGNVIQITKHYGKREGPPGKRGNKEKPTPEEMAEINKRNAERKLTGLMNANFSEGDSHVVLTYRKDQRCPPALAKVYIKKLLADLRTLYRQNGTVLKYIHVTEYKKTAIHHHLVINDLKGVNLLKAVQKIWPYGSTKFTTLYSMEYSKLAEYFIKETNETYKEKDGGHMQRYSCSRNLIRPVPTTEIISKAAAWLKEPRAPKGYFIPKDLVYNGTDWQGRPYQRYTLLKLAAGRPPNYLTMNEQKAWYEKLLKENPKNKEAAQRLKALEINEKEG